MIENPLIALAEEIEYDADLVIDLPEVANCILRKARILRAAAAVIEATRNLQQDVTERKVIWPGEVDFALDALAEFDAACKEMLK